MKHSIAVFFFVCAGSTLLFANSNASLLDRYTKSVGIEIASPFTHGYTHPAGNIESWNDQGKTKPLFGEEKKINTFFGFQFRMFGRGSHFGVGTEIFFTDSHVPWIYTNNAGNHIIKVSPKPWDTAFLFRVPVTSKALFHAGTGITVDIDAFFRDKIPGSNSPLGWNLKFGLEIFIHEDLSLTLDAKYRYWNTGYGKQKYSILAFGPGISYLF